MSLSVHVLKARGWMDGVGKHLERRLEIRSDGGGRAGLEVVAGEHARRLPWTSIMISSRARTTQMDTGGVRVVEDPVQDNVQSKSV
jgi:hypothetical protein